MLLGLGGAAKGGIDKVAQFSKTKYSLETMVFETWRGSTQREKLLQRDKYLEGISPWRIHV